MGVQLVFVPCRHYGLSVAAWWYSLVSKPGAKTTKMATKSKLNNFFWYHSSQHNCCLTVVLQQHNNDNVDQFGQMVERLFTKYTFFYIELSWTCVLTYMLENEVYC